ncbi:AraC family transcriptional regulator [Fulvimonas sp. R45]|uniref:helix-turn-helix domain-containing protein n=1 Tax=Fulvimonas sp. R45 TaxID=3045937 RepID=UPI00265F7A97|nr:AraC family transcriptional regulator [Fulvimonas sp. R45]MDO1529740.1 AraC family transcriptional regulator [Fulvimonas sp. R45]
MGWHSIVPAPPLDALVETLWDWDMPPAAYRRERILPVPGTSLVINLHQDETRVWRDDGRCERASGSVIGGPFRHGWIIDTDEQVRVMGLAFRPGGAHALLGIDVQELALRDVDLDALCGPAVRRLRQRLLETPCPLRRLALLQDWLRGLHPDPVPDPVVTHAVATLACAPQLARIGALQRDSGWSAHRFATRFRRQVGMTPKQFARLLRFRAVVAQAHPQREIRWSEIAVDGGYCDQAHLCHEFRAFAGLTPGEFAARRGPWPNHLPLD